MKKSIKMIALVISVFSITLFSITVFAASNNLYTNKFVQVDSGQTVVVGKGSTSNSYGIVLTTIQGIDVGTRKTKVVVRRCSSSACSSFSKTATSSAISLDGPGSVSYTTMGYIGSGYWQGKYTNSDSYASWEGYSTLQGTSTSNTLT